MLEAVRSKVAGWIAPRLQQNPIDFSPGYSSRYFGSGLGSNQPDHDTLLRENTGVPGMATRAIANRVATLDPLVKISRGRINGTLKDETLDDHILKALLDRPHPNYSRFLLMWLTASHNIATGEAYWLKVRNRLRVPMILQPMPPGKVVPNIEGGIISGYVAMDGKGNSIPLELGDVVRFWFPDPETLYTAEGFLGPNAAVADAHKFAEQHLRAHFQNDATPTTILKGSVDAPMPSDPQQERFQQQWVRKYSRRAGTHKAAPVFIPPGWDVIFAAMQSGGDIAPLLEHWQSNELMNFGVPASVLGRVISGDRSAAETNQYVFDLHTVTPIATLIADALSMQLAPDFDPNIWVEFDKFVSDDKDYELRKEDQDLRLKVRSVQQILTDRDEDPELAPWGEFPVGTLADTPYTGEEREFPQLNEKVSDLEEPEETNEEPEPPPEGAPGGGEKAAPRLRAEVAANWTKEAALRRILGREKRFVPRFSRAMRKVFKIQHKSVLAKIEERRSIRAISPDPTQLFDPAGWGELFTTEVEKVREAAYAFAAQETLAALGLTEEFIYTDAVLQQIHLHGAQMVKLVNATTASRIRAALRAALAASTTEPQTLDDLIAAINEIFSGRRRNAATIARTEIHRSTQAAQIEGFRQASVPFKTWIDARDSNVRETHYQDLIMPAPLDGLFTLPSGHQCQHPGDLSLPPGESINCRCDAAPVYGLGDEVPFA